MEKRVVLSISTTKPNLRMYFPFELPVLVCVCAGGVWWFTLVVVVVVPH